MDASNISRQIAETEEEKRGYVEELKTLNKRIERLEEKLDNGEALTADEKADMTKWKARRSELQHSSDLLTQRLRELAADAKHFLDLFGIECLPMRPLDTQITLASQSHAKRIPADCPDWREADVHGVAVFMRIAEEQM